MNETDVESPSRETSVDSLDLAAKRALAAHAREALNKGDHSTADTILSEAAARFPGDSELARLRQSQWRQAQRVTRVHALLAEVRASNEDLRFVQSLGAFREAANLSHGFQFLRDTAFETAVEEAEHLTPHNWRVAAALLREAALLDPQRPVPAGMSYDISRAEREEHIANVLAKVGAGDPEEAQDSITRALQEYPGEAALEASLAALNAAVEEQKQTRRGKLISRLASLRNDLSHACTLEDAERLLAMGEAQAGAYCNDPEFAAILAEFAHQIKRSQSATRALIEERAEDCLEECRYGLQEQPGSPLFLTLQAKANALDRAQQLAEVTLVRGLLENGALLDAQEACRLAAERFPQCFELWTVEAEIKDQIALTQAAMQPDFEGGNEWSPQAEQEVEFEILDAPETVVISPPGELSEAPSAAATAVIDVEMHPTRRFFKRAMAATALVLVIAIAAGSVFIWRLYRARMAETPKHVLEIAAAGDTALTGTLNVRLDVPDAEVFVNSRKYSVPKGAGGVEFKLAPDTYRIWGAHRGYDDSAPVTAAVLQSAETVIQLHLNPKPASLEIRGAEPGTKIKIDGNALLPAGAAVARELAPGAHVVELSRDGFTPKTITRRLGPGEAALLAGPEVHLESTDASLLSPERRAWDRASQNQNVPALQEFIQKYPTSLHAPTAQADVQMLLWREVDKNDSRALRAFASANPDSPYSGQALAQAGQAEQREWDAVDKNNSTALRSFLAAHSASEHTASAASLLAHLEGGATGLESDRLEEGAWRTVNPTVNPANGPAIQNYLAQFPQGRYRLQAQQALTAITALEASKAESAAVLQVIRRFADAWNAKDLDSIVAIQHDLDRRALRAQLAPAKSVAMRISPVAPPEINGLEATVRCRRQADETFADGSVHQNPESVVTYVLMKRGGAWGIEGIR